MKRIITALAAVTMSLCGLTWTPVAAADPAATIKARQKFFGTENVDASSGAVKKDRVIFSWATNTTFAVSILGRVVLLDTYVTRLELAPGRTPFVLQELVDLKPEAIFLGHGHFDHADNAAYIAKLTSAVIYASPEACDQMQADVTRMFNDPNAVNGGAKIIPDANPVPCTGVVGRGSVPGSQTSRIAQLEPLACIVAFKHMHSAAVPYDTTYPAVTPNVTQDPRDAQMYPAGTPATPPNSPASRVPGQIDTRTTTSGALAAGGPIAILYQFVLRSGYNFTFAWHNSAGPLKEGVAPDAPGGTWGPAVGAQVFRVMDALPNTDVEIGSVSTAGLATNALRDAILYQAHLQPKVFIPGHMTTGTNGVGESSSPELFATYRASAAAVKLATPPEVRWMVDPIDYLKPLVYMPGDPRWQNPAKAARIASTCS